MTCGYMQFQTKHGMTHFCFPESFQIPLGNLFLLAPNTIYKKI